MTTIKSKQKRRRKRKRKKKKGYFGVMRVKELPSTQCGKEREEKKERRK